MSERLRLADLLSGLSIVSDLGYGLPIETALRSCLIGTVLARRMDLPEREVTDVFYVSLLFHVGCVAYAHETFELFGDDQAVRRAAVETDLTDMRDIFAKLIPGATRGLPPAARVRGAVRMAVTGRAFGKAHDQASCEVARRVSRRIGLPESVSDSLYDIHEWWNGAGARSLRGEQIARPARIARVATETSELLNLGVRDVVDALRHRARKTLDPAVVAHLASASKAVMTEATSGDPRVRVLDAEPSPVVQIGEADLPRIARAFGELADLKNPFTHGHAVNVTGLSLATAGRLGLDRRTSACLEIAAYLHDVGRVGVSNRIWAKAGTLTTAEWEQVHLHPYHSERILASTAAFTPMARVAGMHHERIDGSGYHRGCRGKDIDIAARVLGCADAFHAMTQRRPHRPALEPTQARDELLREARAGRLDPEVVTAVLDASHLTAGRRQHLRPGGLSDREVEVLRLVVEGCSNPEIGRRLAISGRTAEHHVQHIYDKIGVSTRAAAVLFAVETAREESDRRHLTGRVTYHHGDFLELAETIPPADIVTLDRVINVYPDWKRLIHLSAARAGRLYGLVYPRNTLPVRMVVSVMNRLVWRGPVHASVPSPDVIDKLTRQAGLVRFFSKTTGPWQVAVYRRH